MMTGIKTGRSATQPTRASVPLTRRQFAQAMTGGLATLALGGLFGCAPQQAAAAEAHETMAVSYKHLVMLETVLPHGSAFVAVAPDNPRALPASKLARAIRCLLYTSWQKFRGRKM